MFPHIWFSSPIRKCDVLNRGLSGYNTAQAKAALPTVLPKLLIPQVSVMTVFLGANDAALKDSPLKQYVSVDDFVVNMKVSVCCNLMIIGRGKRWIY